MGQLTGRPTKWDLIRQPSNRILEGVSDLIECDSVRTSAATDNNRDVSGMV